MAKFERHLFICVNDRGPDHPRPSCARRGSAEIALALKKGAYARGLKRVVRVNTAGCLDQCERGVSLVVYPEGVWYGGVRLEDVEEILERHVVGGEPVQRLVLSPDELTGRAAKPGLVCPFGGAPAPKTPPASEAPAEDARP